MALATPTPCSIRPAAGAAAGAVAIYFYQKSKVPSGFLAKLGEADAMLGASNVLAPEAAKELIALPDTLLLDVQDPGSDMIKGSHSASLGTLPFKASTDLADFKDPVIADRAKDKLIIVNCALGGQAKLGAKLLLDYGFTNVKTIEGGCVAYNKACAQTCTKKGGG